MDKAESLYRGGDREEALEMAIPFLDEDDAKIRMRAVRLIGKIGGDKAGAALNGHVQDPDAKVQREIVVALGRMQYHPAIDNLADLVPNADESLARALGNSFRAYGKPGIDKLVERYDSPGETANRGAYKDVLIKVGPDIAPSIIAILKGKSFFENRENFEILQRVKNPRVARLMLPFLKNEEVAEQVIEAVGRLGSGAVDATIEALQKQKGPDVIIRVMESLIRILGELKDLRAVEVLESYSQHESERIRDAVDRALFQIRGY